MQIAFLQRKKQKNIFCTSFILREVSSASVHWNGSIILHTRFNKTLSFALVCTSSGIINNGVWVFMLICYIIYYIMSHRNWHYFTIKFSHTSCVNQELYISLGSSILIPIQFPAFLLAEFQACLVSFSNNAPNKRLARSREY